MIGKYLLSTIKSLIANSCDFFMKKIYLSYIKPKTFSGQSASTDLIKHSLNNNYIFVDLPLYALDRSLNSKVYAYVFWLLKTLKIFPGLLSILFNAKPILYINLGQGYASFVRVLWWLVPLRIIKRNLRIVVSLNGHTFMKWQRQDKQARLFLNILNSARFVTVVGPNQKAKLLEWGLPAKNVLIVPNTCELKCVESPDIIKKQNLQPKQTINLLHLSLLIESKGFPEYLEALEILSKKLISRPIDAILCGPMSFTQYCTKLKTIEEKSTWINSKIQAINSSALGQVHVKWIPGARGTEKDTLFKDAHIFVLPTYFPVEAQPLVLLEALAKGCSIITSTAGEIQSTVNHNCALILEDLSADNIALNILSLIDNNQVRTDMALSGLELINGPLSIQSYGKTWGMIFDGLKN
jgi:glycosyltransferase involved in cell wall biosynthesis